MNFNLKMIKIIRSGEQNKGIVGKDWKEFNKEPYKVQSCLNRVRRINFKKQINNDLNEIETNFRSWVLLCRTGGIGEKTEQQ